MDQARRSCGHGDHGLGRGLPFLARTGNGEVESVQGDRRDDRPQHALAEAAFLRNLAAQAFAHELVGDPGKHEQNQQDELHNRRRRLQAGLLAAR